MSAKPNGDAAGWAIENPKGDEPKARMMGEIFLTTFCFLIAQCLAENDPDAISAVLVALAEKMKAAGKIADMVRARRPVAEIEKFFIESLCKIESKRDDP